MPGECGVTAETATARSHVVIPSYSPRGQTSGSIAFWFPAMIWMLAALALESTSIATAVMPQGWSKSR